MRAPDLGYAPRFLDSFLALSFSRFEGDSTLPPQAGNAGRWVANPYDGELQLQNKERAALKGNLPLK